MIVKKYRLEGNQIEYILKKGESTRSKLFIIRYTENDQGHNRYCIIISRKISAKAVIRNKLKRRIYEAIQANEQTNKSNLDIILIPKKESKNAKFEDIDKDIRWINSIKS